MVVEDIDVYDGNLIHSRFAYKFFKDRVLPIGNIIGFRAPMHVETEGMIDEEDIINGEYIYSDDAMNFCWEIPNLCELGAVAFQRLFNTQVGNLLSTQYLNIPIEIDGDDLIVHKEHNQGGIIQQKGKCSVSITYSKNGTAIGHTGINVTAGKKAPAHAFSTNLNEEDSQSFMKDVVAMFYTMVDDMFIATTKVICK
jgi:hypothetical protein